LDSGFQAKKLSLPGKEIGKKSFLLKKLSGTFLSLLEWKYPGLDFEHVFLA
jgi:hypothetical protein